MVTRMRHVEDDATEVRCSMKTIPGPGISPELSPLQNGSATAGQSPRSSEAAFVEIYQCQSTKSRSRVVMVDVETARHGSAVNEVETTTGKMDACQEQMDAEQRKSSVFGEMHEAADNGSSPARVLAAGVAGHLVSGGAETGEDFPESTDLESPTAGTIQAPAGSAFARNVQTTETSDLKGVRAAQGMQAKLSDAQGDFHQMPQTEVAFGTMLQENPRLSASRISGLHDREAANDFGQPHSHRSHHNPANANVADRKGRDTGDVQTPIGVQSRTAAQTVSEGAGSPNRLDRAARNRPGSPSAAAELFGRHAASETGSHGPVLPQMANPDASHPLVRTLSIPAGEAFLTPRTASPFQPDYGQYAQPPRSTDMVISHPRLNPGPVGTSPDMSPVAQQPAVMTRVSAADAMNINGQGDMSFHQESADAWHPRLEASLIASSPGADIQSQKPDMGRFPVQQAAEQLLRHPDRSIEISLHPRELGRVHMVLSASDAGMTLTITADRSETLDLMRRHIDQLAQEFRNMGHGDVGFAFRHGGADRQENHNQGGARIDVLEEAEIAAHLATPTPGRPSGLDLRL